MTTIAHSTSDLVCPLFQKAMKKVCHTCAWWNSIKGKNVNTGEPLDNWNCAINLFLVMQFEVANQVRHVDGTMQAFRTETSQTNVAALALGMGVKHEIRHQQNAISLDNCKVLPSPAKQGESSSNEACEEQGSLFGD